MKIGVCLVRVLHASTSTYYIVPLASPFKPPSSSRGNTFCAIPIRFGDRQRFEARISGADWETAITSTKKKSS